MNLFLNKDIAGLPDGQEKLRKMAKVRKNQVKIGVFEKSQEMSGKISDFVS